jgi:uncharacterized protein
MRSQRSYAAVALGCAALIAAGLALRPGGGPATALAAASPAPSDKAISMDRYLSFSGTSSVTLDPDTASISASVHGDGDSAGAALNVASAKMTTLLAALKSLDGVTFKKGDLVTDGVSTYKDWNEDKPNHWLADQSLTITLRQTDKAGPVIAAVAAAGGDNVSGPSFSLEDQRAAYRQALRGAISEARAKADAAAEAMGAQVSGVISISEQGGSVPAGPVAYDVAAAKSTGGTVAPPPIEQGSITVPATVTVVFGYELKG